MLKSWIQLLALTAGFHASVFIGNFRNLQYKTLCIYETINQLFYQKHYSLSDFIAILNYFVTLLTYCNFLAPDGTFYLQEAPYFYFLIK